MSHKISLDARLFQVVDIKQIAQRAFKEQSLTTAILMGRAAQAAFDSIIIIIHILKTLRCFVAQVTVQMAYILQPLQLWQEKYTLPFNGVRRRVVR